MGPKRKRHVEWMGSSKEDLSELPFEAKQRLTYGIYLAELGKRHPDATPMVGIDADEIVCDYDSDTFRAVYTLCLDDWVYVLHCFQKKSKKGRATPKRDIALIRQRLKDAKNFHKQAGRDKTPKK